MLLCMGKYPSLFRNLKNCYLFGSFYMTEKEKFDQINGHDAEVLTENEDNHSLAVPGTKTADPSLSAAGQ